MDLSVLLALNHVARSTPLLRHASALVATWGPEGMALIMAVIFLAHRPSDDRCRRAVIYGAGAAIVALVVSVILGALIFRERPEFADPRLVTALVPHANDSSFPSDHAAIAFALAIALFYWGWTGWPFLAGAFLVALCRVAVGVHWPSDVLAGAAVGVLAALLILETRDWYEKLIVAPVLRIFSGTGPTGA